MVLRPGIPSREGKRHKPRETVSTHTKDRAVATRSSSPQTPDLCRDHDCDNDDHRPDERHDGQSDQKARRGTHIRDMTQGACEQQET